jgi:hypothetical protein
VSRFATRQEPKPVRTFVVRPALPSDHHYDGDHRTLLVTEFGFIFKKKTWRRRFTEIFQPHRRPA